MPIGSPEFPTLFGALDSEAFSEDGGPFNSYALRVLAKNTNRLLGKGQLLCSLAWPLQVNVPTIDSQIDTSLELRVMPLWTMIHPPILCPKKPGLNSATAKIVATIGDSGDAARILVQVITRATGRDRLDTARIGDSNVFELVGDGSRRAYTLAGIPIDSGESELIEIWARSSGGSVLMDTGTFGSPNSGTHNASGCTISRDRITVTGASWGTSAPTLATTSHMVFLYDVDSGLVGVPRMIRDVESATVITMAPLDLPQVALVTQGPGSFEIRSYGTTSGAAISGISIAADARIL